MKITKVKASFGRTYNLGNYESARVDVELQAEVEPGEVDEAVKTLFQECRAHVAEQAKQ